MTNDKQVLQVRGKDTLGSEAGESLRVANNKESNKEKVSLIRFGEGADVLGGDGFNLSSAQLEGLVQEKRVLDDAEEKGSFSREVLFSFGGFGQTDKFLLGLTDDEHRFNGFTVGVDTFERLKKFSMDESVDHFFVARDSLLDSGDGWYGSASFLRERSIREDALFSSGSDGFKVIDEDCFVSINEKREHHLLFDLSAVACRVSTEKWSLIDEIKWTDLLVQAWLHTKLNSLGRFSLGLVFGQDTQRILVSLNEMGSWSDEQGSLGLLGRARPGKRKESLGYEMSRADLHVKVIRAAQICTFARAYLRDKEKGSLGRGDIYCGQKTKKWIKEKGFYLDALEDTSYLRGEDPLLCVLDGLIARGRFLLQASDDAWRGK